MDVKKNKYGEGKVLVSTTIDDETYNYILKQCFRLGITKTQYLRRIIIKWYDAGCPSLTEAEAALKTLDDYQEKTDPLKRGAELMAAEAAGLYKPNDSEPPPKNL